MHSQKQEVCVVIPVYKATLTDAELFSLHQCASVLGRHPRFIIKPALLELPPDLPALATFQVLDFPDHYFDNIQSYNRLMLSAEFYGRFLSYRYLLLYQLDALVFRDELLDWCRRGYDYIGAPWRIEIEFGSAWQEWVWTWKQRLATWLNCKEEKFGLYGPCEIIFKRKVGNGGLSLRRVERFHTLCQRYAARIEAYLKMAVEHPAYNEDAFWSIELNRYWSRLRIPGWQTALAFSVEQLPEKAYQILGGLPFGCHAWELYSPEFWEEHLER
jgi:hypothetical protein